MKSRGLAFDIETSYIITEQIKWGLYDERPIEEKIIQDWQILSIAWQWIGEKKVHVLGQDDFSDYKPGVINDYSLLHEIKKLLDSADYVLAHNGDRFDMKKINARMIIQGIEPYSPVQQIDTLKMAKRIGGFSSNRLKDLAKDFEVNQKGDPGGFGTWKGCVAGDKKAWKHMKKYNKADIPPLVDIYMTLRSWDKQGFALNLAEDKPDSCPTCGKGPLTKQGFKFSKTNTYQQYKCLSCKSWCRSRVADERLKEERMEFVK